MMPRLMAITAAASPAERVCVEQLLFAAAPGEVVVQLRDRSCSASELAERGRALAALTRASAQRLIVNERVDVALAVGADGVHLPAFGLAPSEARSLVGKGSWLSRALHAPDELAAGELTALDAVVISPVIEPRKGREALGLPTFRNWAERCRGACPRLGVYALGGVTSASAAACLAATASGVAVMGAAADPLAARQLIEALGIVR